MNAPANAVSLLTSTRHLAAGVVRSLVVVVAPQGGQLGSRRNAWESMSADVRAAHARRQTEIEVRQLIAAPRKPMEEAPSFVG
jgi:hypothetical protein